MSNSLHKFLNEDPIEAERRMLEAKGVDYNSPYLDTDIIYNYLARGIRTPQNETEKRWAKEGQSILAQGGGYDIFFE